VVSGALSTALENSGKTLIFVSGRTHNRSRSPRSVTSGKGLALRVGSVGLRLEASG
ncbi:predicted protein, partial [Nematostella vectensis]